MIGPERYRNTTCMLIWHRNILNLSWMCPRVVEVMIRKWMMEWQKGLIGIGRGHKNGLNMTLSLRSGTSTLYELLVYQVWSTSSKMFSIFKVNDTPMLIQIQFINTLRYVTSKQRRDFYFVGVMYKFWCQSSKEL